jgi:hypothetical protein
MDTDIITITHYLSQLPLAIVIVHIYNSATLTLNSPFAWVSLKYGSSISVSIVDMSRSMSTVGSRRCNTAETYGTP